MDTHTVRTRVLATRLLALAEQLEHDRKFLSFTAVEAPPTFAGSLALQRMTLDLADYEQILRTYAHELDQATGLPRKEDHDQATKP